jgi:hypothetical protein
MAKTGLVLAMVTEKLLIDQNWTVNIFIEKFVATCEDCEKIGETDSLILVLQI